MYSTHPQSIPDAQYDAMQATGRMETAGECLQRCDSPHGGTLVLEGHILDPVNRRRLDGVVVVENGRIAAVEERDGIEADAPCILPGFVDAHVHIESSMLLPAEFARVALKHGTVAAVCDPHEIANVLGIEGIDYMIRNSKLTPMRLCFAAPSCVPSTQFETSGAEVGVDDIDSLMHRHDIYALGEMMNSVGVVADDPMVMAKIASAIKAAKPIDGHAPLLTGEPLRKYAAAGISTDHECSILPEAQEKLALGLSILIRSGSAANNFDTLEPLLASHSEKLMFCTDDKHPDDLLSGHINQLVRKAVRDGYPLWNVLHAACVEPVRHYRLPVGLLQPGDKADFIVVDNDSDWNIVETYLDGQPASAHNSDTQPQPACPNQFRRNRIATADLQTVCQSGMIRVINATDSSIITDETIEPVLTAPDGTAAADPQRDILKIVVANRYNADVKPQVAFIRGFGLTRGAIASSIAHDCHNLIAVGADDQSIAAAINRLVEEKGGIAVCDPQSAQPVDALPLPVAGLMSPLPAVEVATAYQRLNNEAHSLGCPFHSPFMALSFMALPVIPHLKLTDKGLFDGDTFSFTNLFTDTPARP